MFMNDIQMHTIRKWRHAVKDTSKHGYYFIGKVTTSPSLGLRDS